MTTLGRLSTRTGYPEYDLRETARIRLTTSGTVLDPINRLNTIRLLYREP